MFKQLGATVQDTLFCLEYTGIYNLPVLRWLQGQSARVWLESAVQISQSTGVSRGKNDKVDSARIALYAFTNRHQIKLWQAPKPVINKIAALLSQRSRLVKAKKQLVTAFKEQKLFMEKDTVKSLKRHTEKPAAVLQVQITAVETEI